MLARDQSHANRDTSDSVQMEVDKKIRRKIFMKNYEQSIDLTHKSGFPNISIDSLPADSFRYFAITTTLIHIAQSQPALFLEVKTLPYFN